MKKINQSYAYCEEQDKWIKENVSGRLCQSIADEFLDTFGIKRSIQALKVRANRIGARPKLNRLVPFKSTKTNKEGGQSILISKDPIKWTDRARWEYENIHGVKLTSNDVIVSLDGDRLNYNKSNLIKMTRSENLRLNKLRNEHAGAPLGTLALLARLDNVSANLNGKGDWSSDEIEWLGSNLAIRKGFNRVAAFNAKFNKSRSAREISMMAAVIRRRNEQ